MKNHKRVRLVFGAGLVAAWAAVASASPGTSVLVQARLLLESEGAAARVLQGRGALQHPGSFVRVRRGGVPAMESPARRVRVDGAIVVPLNARAGDPAYAEAPVDEAGEWEEYPVEEARYGTIFADGIELQYGSLRGPDGVHHRHVPRRAARRGAGVEEHGAEDLHRSAQLRFAEAAQPRLGELEGAWRRAQLEFHRSTLTAPPGVRRGADGLRHERSRPGPAGRTRW